MAKRTNRVAWWFWVLLLACLLGSGSVIGLLTAGERPPDEMEEVVERWDDRLEMLVSVGAGSLLLLVIGLAGALKSDSTRSGTGP